MRVADACLDQLFRHARTARGFLPGAIAPEQLRELYELTRLGPTTQNSQPARYVFLATPAARERLVPALTPGNVEKVRAAPVTVIVAYDSRFYDLFSKVWHVPTVRDNYVTNAAHAELTALRNSSLQGAYLILAARALGLDCGPMSGFSLDKVNAEFFPDGRWKANFLCNLGHADPARTPPERSPRLAFDEACQVL